MRIEAIPTFRDNYVWLLHDAQNAIVIDPGDAPPVEQTLKSRGLHLREIWVTHHHPDHIAGISALRRTFPDVIVHAPTDSPLADVQCHHRDNDHFSLLIQPDIQVTVWFIPGHTADHIAYVVHLPAQPCLFCGDTLFGAGCGRLLGGTADQLFASLQRIAGLPDTTQVYCAHEYTESNLRFARHVEPDNPDILARSERVHLQRVKGEATVPFPLAEERKTNPFLRTDTPTVRRAVLNQSLKKIVYPNEIFRELRRWKDTF